jgi:hypothetical protein
VYIRKLAVSSILLHQLSAFLINHHHPALWLVDQSTGSPGTRAPLLSCTVAGGGFLQRLLLPLWITDENQVPLSSCRGFFVGLLILMVDRCCVRVNLTRATEEQGKDRCQIDLITWLIDGFEFKVATLI